MSEFANPESYEFEMLDGSRVKPAQGMGINAFEMLQTEIVRARTKFPGNRFLLAALTEEVGELAAEMLQGNRQKAMREALQVACVAIRIFEEGDSSFADQKPEEMLP